MSAIVLAFNLFNIQITRNTLRVSSVLAYWIHAQVVMESNPGRVNNFFVSCNRHFVVLQVDFCIA
jgi:hypothetical protein